MKGSITLGIYLIGMSIIGYFNKEIALGSIAGMGIFLLIVGIIELGEKQ